MASFEGSTAALPGRRSVLPPIEDRHHKLSQSTLPQLKAGPAFARVALVAPAVPSPRRIELAGLLHIVAEAFCRLRANQCSAPITRSFVLMRLV